MYTDYVFYKEAYKGHLPETEYARHAVRAAAELNRMTMQRASSAVGTDAEAVKYGECAIIDELAFQALGGSGDVTSESNDGISRSYATGAVGKSSRQRIEAAAYTWLCNTDLLYVGV